MCFSSQLIPSIHTLVFVAVTAGCGVNARPIIEPRAETLQPSTPTFVAHELWCDNSGACARTNRGVLCWGQRYPLTRNGIVPVPEASSPAPEPIGPAEQGTGCSVSAGSADCSVATLRHGTYQAHVPSIESWSSATEFLIWLDEEGIVWTLGSSIDGIGLGDQECATTPERVPLPDRAVAVHADHLVGYAVLASGDTFAWGMWHASVFGIPGTSLPSPTRVPSSIRARHLSTSFRSLALWNDSEIEFRFGRHLDRHEVPTVIRQPLHSPTTVCVGSAHVCTLDSVGCGVAQAKQRTASWVDEMPTTATFSSPSMAVSPNATEARVRCLGCDRAPALSGLRPTLAVVTANVGCDHGQRWLWLMRRGRTSPSARSALGR